MAGFAEHYEELKKIGASVVAASVDDIDKAKEIAEGKPFPVGYGVTRDMADAIGAWWEDRRSIIQPSEFIVGPDGKVVISSYSDGPLARMEAEDVVKVINFYASRG